MMAKKSKKIIKNNFCRYLRCHHRKQKPAFLKHVQPILFLRISLGKSSTTPQENIIYVRPTDNTMILFPPGIFNRE
jgi:hypothetical protein